MDDKVGRLGQSVDLANRNFERCGDIGVGRLVKTNVAVADLNEVEICAFRRAPFTAGEYS